VRGIFSGFSIFQAFSEGFAGARHIFRILHFSSFYRLQRAHFLLRTRLLRTRLLRTRLLRWSRLFGNTVTPSRLLR
jgi:hypothetical protein